MAESKVNWELLKAEYIYGKTERNDNGIFETKYPTVKDLALKHQISEQRIYEKSSQDEFGNWTLQRSKVKTKLRAKLNQDEINSLVNASAKYDLINLSCVDMTYQLIKSYFEPHLEFINGGYTEENPPRILAKEIVSITTALKNLHELVRNIEGEPINNAEIMKELIKQDVDTNSKTSKQTRQHEVAKFIAKQDAKEKRKQELLIKREELLSKSNQQSQ